MQLEPSITAAQKNWPKGWGKENILPGRSQKVAGWEVGYPDPSGHLAVEIDGFLSFEHSTTVEG